MFLRSSLRSVARAEMSAAGADGVSYEGLRRLLREEYKESLTAEQVYRTLRERSWDQIITLELFVLARRAAIPEMEAVHIVVDHLADINPDARSCLSGADSAARLKQLLRFHKIRLFSAVVRRRLPAHRPAAPEPRVQAPRIQPANTVPEVTRCFNCSSTDGHMKSQCPFPPRPRDAWERPVRYLGHRELSADADPIRRGHRGESLERMDGLGRGDR